MLEQRGKGEENGKEDEVGEEEGEGRAFVLTWRIEKEKEDVCHAFIHPISWCLSSCFLLLFLDILLRTVFKSYYFF